MYLWLTIVPGGSSAVLEKKKKGEKLLETAGSVVSVVFTFIGHAVD